MQPRCAFPEVAWGRDGWFRTLGGVFESEGRGFDFLQTPTEARFKIAVAEAVTLTRDVTN
jgi:hypothetical protein